MRQLDLTVLLLPFFASLAICPPADAENLCARLGVSGSMSTSPQSSSPQAATKQSEKRKPAQDSLLESSQTAPRWKLAWSDEFDVDGKVDPTKWTNEINDKTVNAEKQYYMDRDHTAARVRDGKLIVEAKEEKFRDRLYTSARLTSNAEWTYGRFEFRAKTPVGKGTWPAIWMLPRRMTYGVRFWTDNGEIDIMEATGKDQGLVTHAIFSHDDTFWDGRKKIVKIPVPTVDSEFHDYALEWLPGRLDFFIDGKNTYSDRQLPGEDWKKWPFDQDFYLIINLAMGGTLGGPIDKEALPARLEVEYIRVYQPTRTEDCLPQVPAAPLPSGAPASP